jgi:hypothetical protein
LTRTSARAKKRIKGILRKLQTVSAVIALAKPHRIKASHRRRRRVAADHLLYILGNPLSGTDPTGYRSICGAGGDNEESCAIYTPNEDATPSAKNKLNKSGGSTGKTTSKIYGGNGAGTSQGVTGSGERSGQPTTASERGASRDVCNVCSFGGGDSTAQNKFEQLQALREEGIIPEASGPNDAARKVGRTVDGTGRIAKEAGGAAADYAKENPGEVAVFFIPGSWLAKAGSFLKLDKAAKWLGFGEKAAGSAISFRRAEAAGFSAARLPFKDGDTIYTTFLVSKGTVDFAAEARIVGATLHLKDIAVYPRGATKFQIGMGEVLVMRSELVTQARALGFEKLRITGVRYGGANPGKLVDQTIDLME